MKISYVDQGYTGAAPAAEAKAEGDRLGGHKLPEAKRGFLLLPRRWVVERSCLARPLPPPRPRLRTPRPNLYRLPLARLPEPHAQLALPLKVHDTL